MSILTVIETNVAKLAPTALTVIAAVESEMKTLAGAGKKALVVGIIESLAKVAEESDNATAEGIGKMVDLLVSVLNATGLFKHAQAS